MGTLARHASSCSCRARGVDFAVVGDVAVRMGEMPGGEGVGGEALMHQGKRGDAARILEIEIVLADLIGKSSRSLVADGPRRHGRGVEPWVL